ncbi:MAG: thioredoxin family protein [Oscillospiraceae bacterium]|nr:thioredoxin family protein [Oscillospiraceae bacterium]
MQNINNDNFEEEVLKSDKTVMVEFFSDGCVPCKRMSPILAELEEEYNELKFVKLNISFGAETAKKYDVMSSPTFIFFKDGNEIKRVRGVVPRDDMEDIIEEVSA